MPAAISIPKRNGYHPAVRSSTTSTPIMSTMSTAPIHRRVLSIDLRAPCRRPTRRDAVSSQAPEATLARRVVLQGPVKCRAIEIGPALFRDPEFGVGDLPEEKIADAHLAGRPDQK